MLTHPTTPAERLARHPGLTAEIKAAALSAGLTCTDQEAAIAAGSYLQFGHSDPGQFGLGMGCGIRDESVRMGALMAVRAWVAAQEMARAA